MVSIERKGTLMSNQKVMLMAAHPDFDPEKVWVLLWSQAQGALHKETLAQMFEGHARAFAEDRGLQYVPLLIGDRAVIDDLAKKITPTVAARYNAAHDLDTGFIPYEEMP